MRESSPFINLTECEGSISGVGPSKVKEELEEEDEEAQLVRKYVSFILGDAM
jgi:hypothetical protein